MKRNLFIYSVILVGTMIMFQSFTGSNSINSTTEEIEIPSDVKLVLDNKCFGCHNIDAKSDKAKDKLLLDKLSDLSKAKLVAALGEIHEVMVEDEMPPEKFLEKKPEAKLTEEENKLIKDWAEKAADDLMK